MAEGYTQSFIIKKHVYDQDKGIYIDVNDSETIPLDVSREVTSIEYTLPNTLTFYDTWEGTIGTYNIQEFYTYKETTFSIEYIQLDGYDVEADTRYDIYSVPEIQTFDVYYYGTPQNVSPETPGTTLTLIPSSLSLFVGGTGTITATTNSQQSITWSSNDTTVATVNSTGNSATVTAISSGFTKITASVEGITKLCDVTVSGASDYTLNIYDESKTDIIRTTKIPKNALINKYIYDTRVYDLINNKNGEYISEWKNYTTNAIITDEQTMVGGLDIYPVYTEIDAEFYSIVHLPNLTQRFPFGANRTSYKLGSTGGLEEVALTSEECALPSHSHAVLVDTDTSPVPTLPSGGQVYDVHTLNQTTQSETYYSKDTSNKYNSPVVYEAEKTEADSPHTNMPPYLTVNFIIKYK